MRFRKLRIAWSVGWAGSLLILMVFWVRSLAYTYDQCFFYAGKSFEVDSHPGYVWFGIMHTDVRTPFYYGSWKLSDGMAKQYQEHRWFRFMEMTTSGWYTCVFSAPHWFLSLIAGTMAAVPWIPRRFSLRTLLIATTLVAVVLGLIVWMSRTG